MSGGVIDEEMRAYYEARAREYDDWWLGRGLFASRLRPAWADETAELVDVLVGLPPARTLDVACGTGFLTQHLPGEITALDQSPGMVEVARERLAGAHVIQGEAVPLPFGDDQFERLFTSHFYGHLLTRERQAFVREARRVAGELVVVDSALHDGVGAEEWQRRELLDGSLHRVYKRYFSGEGLASELGGGEVLHAGTWFVAVRIPAGR